MPTFGSKYCIALVAALLVTLVKAPWSELSIAFMELLFFSFLSSDLSLLLISLGLIKSCLLASTAPTMSIGLSLSILFKLSNHPINV